MIKHSHIRNRKKKAKRIMKEIRKFNTTMIKEAVKDMSMINSDEWLKFSWNFVGQDKAL